MDIRIEGMLETVLLELAEHNQEPTATGMIRVLIRDAAKQHGLWQPKLNGSGAQREKAAESAQP